MATFGGLEADHLLPWVKGRAEGLGKTRAGHRIFGDIWGGGGEASAGSQCSGGGGGVPPLQKVSEPTRSYFFAQSRHQVAFKMFPETQQSLLWGEK